MKLPTTQAIQPTTRAPWRVRVGRGTPAEVMGGHGGHGEMSMAAMIRDMRDRFLVAVVFGVVITLWSRIGRDVFGFTVAAPFGLRDDVFQLILSVPVIFYSAQVFFAGAYRALRARTLDMMVLVAVAVGAGWVYSVGVTLTGGGDVFYEAATILTAFVLLGHYFEMRARGWRQRRRPCTAQAGPRPWRPCSATVSRWRSPPPIRSWWAICCWFDPVPRSPSTGWWRTATATSTSPR